MVLIILLLKPVYMSMSKKKTLDLLLAYFRQAAILEQLFQAVFLGWLLQSMWIWIISELLLYLNLSFVLSFFCLHLSCQNNQPSLLITQQNSNKLSTNLVQFVKSLVILALFMLT